MEKEGLTLILGAGPAGLAASFELHRAGKPCLIIEKNESVGGLSRTFRYGKFITDIGPHRFFSQNKYLYDLIEDLLGGRWIPVDRLTRFYVNGKFFMYPIEIKNALVNVGPYKAFRILIDYSLERFKRIFGGKKAVSFEEQAVSDFGRTLAELNMLNYTEKIWGLPCSEISPDWSKQRIKDLSLTEVLKKAVFKSKKGPKTLVDRFYYPDTGTGLIYEKLKERASDGKNCRFSLNSSPVKVMHDNKKIVGAVIQNKDGNQTVNPEYLISSIPITEFICLLEPAAPASVLAAAKKLKFRSHVSLILILNKPHIFQDQWIYLPDKEIPFGRIMEPKNFSKQMSPPDKTSLLLEFFCWENDNIWNATKEELISLSVGWLEKLGFNKKEDIINSFVHREKYAYPVYDLHYKERLNEIFEYLARFENLQLIGRSGRFRYNNQDHALEMGTIAARNIVDGKKYDLDKVGAEQKYFERGYVR